MVNDNDDEMMRGGDGGTDIRVTLSATSPPTKNMTNFGNVEVGENFYLPTWWACAG